MPVILRGLNIGPCCEKWTVGYMAEAIKGAEVKVHVSSEKQMDFITKNFIYRLGYSVLIGVVVRMLILDTKVACLNLSINMFSP